MKIAGTPTAKGLYKDCKECVHRIQDSTKKYPCEFSHSRIRKAANGTGTRYERDFVFCGLKSERIIK